MQRKRCSSCRFRDMMGLCRRLPPAVIGNPPFTGPTIMWPRTGANDWCGEHQDRQDDAAPQPA